MEDKFTIAGDRRKRKADQLREAAGACHLVAWGFVAGSVAVWPATGNPLNCLPLVGMAIFMMLIAIYMQIDGFIHYRGRG
jgi:hypothetical protein